MDALYAKGRFESASEYLPNTVKEALSFVSDEIKSHAAEIRLRAKKPLFLTVGGQNYAVTRQGVKYIVSPREMEETFLNLCNQSIYSHTSEIKQGFIYLKGGHRAGICGTVCDSGIRDINSISIRISHEVIGCAEKLGREFDGGGILIAGPPGSGKTTLLRDAVREFSKNRGYRVAVIDCRGEIAACVDGVPQNDIGDHTDVLTGVDKAAGVEMAVRSMFPQIIAFDEIGNENEAQTVCSCLNCGVSVITSAHIGDIHDLTRRSVTRLLLESGAISRIAFLEKPQKPPQILSLCEVMSLCG